ncbi:MAG: esterase family protein [Pseudomonadales bacterium]|nr:esterase family protein [Pseudomonadales bacterium]
MPMDLTTYQALQLDQPTPAEVNGRSNNDILAALKHPSDEGYEPCAESHVITDVTKGSFEKIRGWTDSTIYPETSRDIATYLPPNYEGQELRILICNDGAGYSALSGPVRVTHVLDNLLARGEIAPTAAIFVNPGQPEFDIEISPTPSYTPEATQRSIEYDSLTPTYGEFLFNEILPLVAAETGANFSSDPEHRTVCGISSGGICAFSVAWFHPEQCQRVISHCGSFTNIRGGHNYPYLVRSTARKPLRVYLQSGEHDGQTIFGDWSSANQAMAKAFDYAGYDYQFDYGVGGHTLRHGGSVFADTLRWLWR